ncbi:MAG: hypothetical protein A2751_05335 [Candidatus Doudnabacteria bacterium RIFCSPHIGHO2_01_FULL_46_14]|uniref:Flagellar protein FliL n=1 Tax=Candidatus Doudnabacteria bacterium RIFCSPHIGHO2_01_FULL_46_14 TaxID=1817824 RepID=A0A1F5NP10_9BACT|nr:MAG: hypothetical protein A2751_05335 [Candidatus Doudnabacteria bacterium RIFCSPHIGHO2_01_FULL_46_14]
MQFVLGFLLFVASINLWTLIVRPDLAQQVPPQFHFTGLIEVSAVGAACVALGGIYGFFRDRKKHGIGLAIISVLAGFGILHAYFSQLTAPPKTNEVQSSDSAPQVLDIEQAGVIPLEPFVVNLADLDAARYLRAKISIMVDDKTKMQVITDNDAVQFKIRDVILRVLTAKTSTDLVSQEGKDKLRQEIRYEVAPYFKSARMPMLVDVMFTEFVIQL